MPKLSSLFERLSVVVDSNQNNQKTYLWIDTLGVLSLMKLIFFGKDLSVGKIFFREINAMGRFLFKSGLLKRYSPEQVHYEMSDLFLEKEVNVFWGYYRDSSDKALDIGREQCVDKGLLDQLDSKYSKKKISLFLNQEIAREIRPYIKFNNIVNSLIRQNQLDQFQHILIVKDNPWIESLGNYKTEYFKDTLTYPVLKNFLLGQFYVIKLFWEFIVNSIGSLVAARLPEKKEKGKIAVLHVQGADLDRKCDYFWFNNANIDPKNLLVYFRVPYKKPNEEVLRKLKEYGMTWANILPVIPFKKCQGFNYYYFPSYTYVQKLMGLFKQLVRLFIAALKHSNKKICFWQFNKLIMLLNHAIYYESIFADHNIKVHFSLFEVNIPMSATNLAADLVGAIDITSQYSNYPMTFLDHGKPHDVYFAWGPFYKGIFDKRYFQVDQLIYFGYVNDRFFSKENVELKNLRQGLREKGAEFVLCFFDEAYLKDDSYSREDFAHVYKALLKHLKENPSWGIMIKPKKVSYYQNELKEIMMLIEEAQLTGRCILLDEIVMPIEAAKASDLVVGFGLSNTAALEAALSGVPTITLDYGEKHFHPFFKQGLGKTVFRDFDEAAVRIKQCAHSADMIKEYFDFSFLLNGVDDFRDGSAARRVGGYIKDLLDEVNRGSDKQTALEYANAAYRDKWGEDKVVDFSKLKQVRSDDLVETLQKC